MHSGDSKLALWLTLQTGGVLLDKLDVPHEGLLYDRRLDGNVPRNFWNY